MAFTQRAIRAMKAKPRPDGFNVGPQANPPVGSLAEHLHMHVVPRGGRGRANFITSHRQAKVIPQLLRHPRTRSPGWAAQTS